MVIPGLSAAAKLTVCQSVFGAKSPNLMSAECATSMVLSCSTLCSM